MISVSVLIAHLNLNNKHKMYKFLVLNLIIVEFGAFAVGEYSSEIVVKVAGGALEAQLLAEKSGHYFKGPVLGFTDTYIFIPVENVFPNHHKREMKINKRLVDDHRVLWAEVQQIKVRQKRDYRRDLSDIPLTRQKRFRKKIYKKPLHLKYDKTFNDELWSQEWYLQDTRFRSDIPKLDLNVLPLYKAGITGKGVRISILDDGIEYTHDDLKDNYDAEISYDCNEEDKDPMPRYESTKFNSHGTRCAGEIAMAANNGKCGVGIAYNSKIGGVKLLDGVVTDRIEGTALSYARSLVDIYSASWGPSDDGKTVDGPGRLAKQALKRGVEEGRNGLGAIYVWASGNGGSKNDNCNCDGYLASPYTISIGSASQRGEFPWYGEACASTLAVTYSSGAYKDQMITTTDLHNECTIKHTGTSASAPLAAGIIALTLEVNPTLTWRDVQHLIVWTSEINSLIENSGWTKNAAGLWFNTKFGFGLMNAFDMAKAAANWTTVPEKRVCTVKASHLENNKIVFGYPTTIHIYTTGCEGSSKEINYIEHVEVKTTIIYNLRGVLEVYLTSPSGSKVQLLSTRKYDTSSNGFKNWTFMSVMQWGEMAKGLWTITVIDRKGPVNNTGIIEKTSLILHGTRRLPVHMRKTRKYNYGRSYYPLNSLDGFNNKEDFYGYFQVKN